MSQKISVSTLLSLLSLAYLLFWAVSSRYPSILIVHKSSYIRKDVLQIKLLAQPGLEATLFMDNPLWVSVKWWLGEVYSTNHNLMLM